MVWAKYASQRDMLKRFTANNSCEMCYISTRANTEKKLGDFLADNWGMLVGKVFARRAPQLAAGAPGVSAPEPTQAEPESTERRSMAAR